MTTGVPRAVSEQIAAGPVHTGPGGWSANKGVDRGLWYGVSRGCRPLWSPQPQRIPKPSWEEFCAKGIHCCYCSFSK